MAGKRTKYSHINVSGFHYDLYQRDDNIFDYMPIWELNNNLVIEDPSSTLVKDKTKKSESSPDTKIVWLSDELVLSFYGASSKIRIVTDHIIVLIVPIICWFYSWHIPLLLYSLIFTELIFGDEEQESDMITWRKEDWMYETNQDLYNYHFYEQFFKTSEFDLKGNTILGYGEKWGVMPSRYSANIDYWFDINMETIMLIQETCPEILNLEEVLDDANSELGTLYSPNQQRYSDNNNKLELMIKSRTVSENVSYKEQDLKYSLYNFYDMIYHMEKNTYRRKGKASNIKIINVLTDRFKINLNSILYTDGVRDFEWSTYFCFLEDNKLKKSKKKSKKKKNAFDTN